MSALAVPDLPPPFTPIWLREHGDAFAHACRLAPGAGAGTLVWVRRFDTCDLAVVLEPEEELAEARRVVFAGLEAAAEALAALGPPALRLGFAWPDAILCDGALVGGARLAWPDDTAEDAVPDWLVLGLTLRVEAPHALPAGRPRPAALGDLGFAGFETATFVGRYAHCLAARLEEWEAQGPASQQRRWQQRAPGLLLSPSGDLLHPAQLLAEALAVPSWLDPATGEIRG